MTPDPSPTATVTPTERRQAVWPWLLLPLVVLTMFFLLKTAKDSLPANAVDSTEAPAHSIPSDDVESP